MTRILLETDSVIAASRAISGAGNRLRDTGNAARAALSDHTGISADFVRRAEGLADRLSTTFQAADLFGSHGADLATRVSAIVAIGSGSAGGGETQYVPLPNGPRHTRPNPVEILGPGGVVIAIITASSSEFPGFVKVPGGSTLSPGGIVNAVSGVLGKGAIPGKTPVRLGPDGSSPTTQPAAARSAAASASKSTKVDPADAEFGPGSARRSAPAKRTPSTPDPAEEEFGPKPYAPPTARPHVVERFIPGDGVGIGIGAPTKTLDDPASVAGQGSIHDQVRRRAVAYGA
ncbi:MAG: hypothetical protein AAGC46_12820 [Solirubrobacteraceae bacterium]|nr:hypothetical protein [Patulibacter sp.]